MELLPIIELFEGTTTFVFHFEYVHNAVSRHILSIILVSEYCSLSLRCVRHSRYLNVLIDRHV